MFSFLPYWAIRRVRWEKWLINKSILLLQKPTLSHQEVFSVPRAAVFQPYSRPGLYFGLLTFLPWHPCCWDFPASYLVWWIWSLYAVPMKKRTQARKLGHTQSSQESTLGLTERQPPSRSCDELRESVSRSQGRVQDSLGQHKEMRGRQ